MKTKEGNKLIAEFMGLFETKVEYLYYNDYWDWLMPVVEKIGKTGKGGGLLYGLKDALILVDIDWA